MRSGRREQSNRAWRFGPPWVRAVAAAVIVAASLVAPGGAAHATAETGATTFVSLYGQPGDITGGVTSGGVTSEFFQSPQSPISVTGGPDGVNVDIQGPESNILLKFAAPAATPWATATTRTLALAMTNPPCRHTVSTAPPPAPAANSRSRTSPLWMAWSASCRWPSTRTA